MARADLLISLVKSGTQGDRSMFRKTVEAIIAEERTQQHNVLADNLAKFLAEPEVQRSVTLSSDASTTFLFEMRPTKRLDDLVLLPETLTQIHEFLEEHRRIELLRSYSLEPRHKLLLRGAPGTGKTSLVEAIAENLSLPLLVVRYESVIGSYLGETAARLKRIFEYARTRRCVLFFDEFETLGKERGDVHDTGEIKRVVSSLLLQIDSLPSHVIVATATNHAELLDRAVARRFEVRIDLPLPSPKQLEQYLTVFSQRTGIDFGAPASRIAKTFHGLPISELEEFCLTVARRYLLEQPGRTASEISQTHLARREKKSLPKARTTNKKSEKSSPKLSSKRKRK